MHALEIAKAAGVTTILNPAPAAKLPERVFGLCDYVTPNETEAEELTGMTVETVEDARRAADSFLAKGAGTALITLGDKGALLQTAVAPSWFPRFPPVRWWRRPAQAMPSMAASPSACRAVSSRSRLFASPAPSRAFP